MLLPIGAFEQHGPAMPLATDLIRAEAVAERVADLVGERVLIGPAVPVGISPHHLAFAGTVSLRPETFLSVLRDYLDSLAGHGFVRVLAINGHGGNNAALSVLAQDLMRERPGIQFAWTPLTTLAAEHLAGMERTAISGHCGEAETSQMLAIAPDLVHSAPGTAPAATAPIPLPPRGRSVPRRYSTPLCTRPAILLPGPSSRRSHVPATRTRGPPRRPLRCEGEHDMITTTPTPSPTPAPDADRLPLVIRILGVIERVGNKLPYPFWLFWVLAAILGIASAIMAAAGVMVVSPSDGEEVAVRNLFSGDGVAMAFSTAIDNFASFPPVATIVVVIMGVAVAERTGFLAAAMKVGVSRVPASWVVFAVAFIGTVSHVASAAAYVILVPLGGLAFRAVGRSPILGIVVAYTAIASGYDASPVPTPNDAIFAGITTAAARIVDPEAYVSPLSNWFFNIASSVLLAGVITLVTKLVLSKRPDLDPDPDLDLDDIGTLHLTDRERSALRVATLTLLGLLVLIFVVLLPEGSPLRGEGAGIAESPFMEGIAMAVALIFGVTGAAYGFRSGALTSPADVPKLMAEGIKKMAPVLVLFFAIAQFLAYFDWTRIGDVIAVEAALLLQTNAVPIWLIFLMVLFLLTIVNVMITSGSAMWPIAAPVLVPMLMLLAVPAETTQALFRIADSGSTAITPMSPYFVMALGFLQHYRKSAGIGTLASFTLPLAIAMTFSWTILFFVWWWLGIPLGPGAPVR